MHPYHRNILENVKKHAREKDPRFNNETYFGNKDIFYRVPVLTARTISKQWIKHHPNISKDIFESLITSLFQGNSHEEKTIAGKLLEYAPSLRKQLPIALLDHWLDKVQGWAQVDSLCQGVFTACEMNAHWNQWKHMLTLFSKDKNIHKRRASLVLLTGPVTESSHKKFSQLAFSCIEKLKSEKDILITKAISWLLRSMIKHHKNQVAAYMKIHESTLPKIALREVRNKLLTGKK